MSHSDEEEEERDSPLPTPTLPSYLDHQAQQDRHPSDPSFSLQSFSFGGPSSSSSSNGPPGGGTGSNFPDYCLPRRPSGSMWTTTNGIGGIAEGEEEEEDELAGGGRRSNEGINPSPVYPSLNSDGTWVEQTASTPTAEREKFDYPVPQGGEEEHGGMVIPPTSRPGATPNTARRGSISLPNLPTTSNNLHSIPQPTQPASNLSSIVTTQPQPSSSSSSSESSSCRSSTSISSTSCSSSSSSTNTPFLFSPSFNLNLTSFPPRRISLTRSLSSTRPPFPPTGSPSSSSQTHFHPPPTHRFHPSTAPAPVPPSLKNHPALQFQGGRRRGSLPSLSLPSSPTVLGSSSSGILGLGGKRVSEGGTGTFATYASSNARAGLGAGGRRGSLAEKGFKERVAEEEEERSRALGRPRLGSIPSFGSDGSGSGSSGSDGGKTPT
ncbi:hypothetical protein BDY24DRAFT_438207 [Mrakia frigida]|uniref:uncharacterized protein n=1 Tax=Mrakia frigida TaxID=29902 RepID=UPI003FCBEF53